ncbi:MAG: signal recognition particle-docking protein FtsY [Pseudomonadota bacterium]
MAPSDDKPAKRGLFGRLLGLSGGRDAAAPPPEPDAVAAAATAAPEPADGGPPASSQDEASVQPPATKEGWFTRLSAGLAKTSSKLSDGISGLFTKRKLDAATLEELEDLLIQADLGVETAMRITDKLSRTHLDKTVDGDDVRALLAAEVVDVLEPVARPLHVQAERAPHVIVFVGVNGTGKTTTIGKMAQRFRREGKSVMMAAGDTFRAAAIDQLKIWGERTGCTVVAGEVGGDAASLAFEAFERAKADAVDVLLIDTAGRLQNKQGLMDELAKVMRVIGKVDAGAPHDVVLVLDATTGQNAMSQVEVFAKQAGVTGLVMTKLDGTARGGILVAIAAKHGLPVHAIGVGEGADDLQPFDASQFAGAITMH